MNTKDKNPHTNHRERMRQKVKLHGLENFPQHEILEFLLYPLIPRKDTNSIAHELIDKFGSLEKVLDSSPEMLMSVKNMTANASLYLSSLPKIIGLYNMQKFGEKPKLDTINNAVKYFSTLFANSNVEDIYVAVINPRGYLVDKFRVGRQDAQECTMDIKKFILSTANNSVDNIIVAHNHPSGDPSPSVADFDFTNWLVSLCEIVGLKLVDHIIIAGEKFYSFSQEGQLEHYKSVIKDYVKFATAMDKFRM